MASSSESGSVPTKDNTPAKESTHILGENSKYPPAAADGDTEKLAVEDKDTEGVYRDENEESAGTPGHCRKCCSTSSVVSFFRVDRKLVPLKVFYFAFIGGLGCVLPYVSVFLKQLGLSPQEIGLISGIRPVIGFISGPLWGILGDKYNIRRCLLLFSITAWLGFYVALYFIPPADRVDECPAGAHREMVAVEKRLLGRHLDQPAVPANVTLGPSGHPVNVTPEYTQHQEAILRESIGWIYDPDGLQTVFILAFLIIIGGEFVQAPTTALSDAGTLHTLGPAGLDSYGAQRAWGPVGWAISSFVGGVLVAGSRVMEEICGVQLYFSDYRILTYVFIGFMVLAFLAATQLKFKDHLDPEQVELTPVDEHGKEGKEVSGAGHDTRAVFRIFLNVHYGSWITTCFFVGVCNGVIWGFLFWHLENLGADQMLMGVDSVIQCVAEFASFFLGHHIIRWAGHMGIMYAGLLGYSFRFVVYAFVTNPWWVLPADILQGVTFSCVWVSMTAYTAQSVPQGSLATIQGILHGVYFGLGNGLGHLLGGLLIGSFGAPVTFLAMAVSCVVVFLVFIIAQKCSSKPEYLGFGYDDLDKASQETTDK